MTMKKRTLSLVALILSLVFALSFAGFSTFAAEDTSVDVEVEETTEEAATTEAESKPDETKADTAEKTDYTESIINLSVGGVLLIALVVLCIVFRKKIPTWLRSLKSECKKIVWCPKDQLKNSTIVVLVTIVALALVIIALDYGLAEAFELLKDGVQSLIPEKTA